MADAYPGYRLVWSDEFDQAQLNSTRWTPQVDGRGGGNREAQFYTADAVSILPSPASPSGYKGLALTARPIVNRDASNAHLLPSFRSFDVGAPNPHQPYPTQRWYTSGRVHSRGVSFQYGRVDVRARLPPGSHTWPAIWLLPERQDGRSPATTWPNLGEIDVMEMAGKDDGVNGTCTTVSGALNYGTHWADHHYVTAHHRLAQGRFSDDFHVFSILWEPARIQWLLDGQPFAAFEPRHLKRADMWVWGVEDARVLAGDESRQNRFYVILNLAMGGTLGGEDVPPQDQVKHGGRRWEDIDVTASNYVGRADQQMVVDYVRIYQPITGAPLRCDA